jgi:hypothetical protein
MERLAVVAIAAALACGPTASDVVSSSQGEGSATTADDAGATATSVADTTSTSGDPVADTTGAESTTATMPDELPPDAVGEWLCTGFEDPLYLRLSVDDEMQWAGTACGPNLEMTEPSAWTNCADLLPHTNYVGTQAYWTFELAYEDFGGPKLLFEIALSYVPATDTLEGVVYTESTGGYMPEFCSREAG